MGGSEVDLSESNSNPRPRRSCVQKEVSSKQRDHEFSDDTSESDDEKLDKSDGDFRLGGDRKKSKKPKRKHKDGKAKNKKPHREAPTYLSVIRAQQKYEKKYEEVYEDSDSISEDNSNDEQLIQHEESPEPEEQLAPPTKKKKITIRPWNPGWYQIPQK